MGEAYVVDAVRTPFGREGGAFEAVHPQDLAAVALAGLRERNGFDPTDVDDVLLGCVTPLGEQGLNIGRLAPMVAGWGDGVPGVQLDRMCGSSLQALTFAAGDIGAGFADVVVAGGVEHMTRVPMDSGIPTLGTDHGGQAFSQRYVEQFPVTTQWAGAERVAEQWDIPREVTDRLARDSQHRYGAAEKSGHYDGRLTPVTVEQDGEQTVVEHDEHPRPGTDLETLASLSLSFRSEGDGVVHPGNTAGVTDGASAVLVASGRACDRFGWEPNARIVDVSLGTAPVELMHTGSIPATKRVLVDNDLDVTDVDRFEVNEAFAPVVRAWLEETGADWDRTNVWGGAIAHGHPLGATGTALLGKLCDQLEVCNGRYGIATMCISFGQGIATLVERL